MTTERHPPGPDRSRRGDTFVSADELARLLTGDRPPIVLDIRLANDGPDGRPEYAAGHIPGAVFVDVATDLQSEPGGLAGKRPLPDIARLQSRAREWGINDGDAVVVYDSAFGTKAGRAWWVLRWAGVAGVRLLDGGLGAWAGRGHEVSTVEPAPTPGAVTLSAGHLPVLDADGAAEYAVAGRLLDARAPEVYRGEPAEPGQPRTGHIPGAISAPTHGNLTATGLLAGEDTLRRRFAGLGADGTAPVGVYCGGGVWAAHEVAVLAGLGIPAALFVGSFSAWEADPRREVTVGDDPSR
ncbi:sulfurtransferase [Streptosporangium amethystogenes]|uniref:sulfurtransferase n=1 Tax=Streptosporangium amethystogenes TaxID=2002 RepID=UPI0037A098E1